MMMDHQQEIAEILSQQQNQQPEGYDKQALS
jgi:hypothetical protein